MPSEIEMASRGLEVAGVSIFLFVLFYYYMKKQFEMFDRSLTDQRVGSKQTLKATTDAFEKILEEQSRRDDRAYELNKELIGTLQAQAGSISRLENKIDHIRNLHTNSHRNA